MGIFTTVLRSPRRHRDYNGTSRARWFTRRVGRYCFFLRKFWFTCLWKALVVFPGGFEILTLAQTKK